MFLSKLYRKLRIYLDVIIVSAIMGFFAYQFTANSLKNTVDRYFTNITMEEELASYIAQDIKSDVESLLVWVSACIVVLVIILFIAGVYLARMRGRVKTEYIE